MTNQKLYIITRQDLLPGLQAAQITHAAVDFIFKYPEQAQQWRNNSNYVVALSVANEAELTKLAINLVKTDIDYCLFKEPDLNEELTAIAVLPKVSMFGHLPLALRSEQNASYN